MAKKMKAFEFGWRCDGIIQKYDSKQNKQHLQIDLTDNKEQLRIVAANDETFFKQGDIYKGTLKLEREGTTPTTIDDFVDDKEDDDE